MDNVPHSAMASYHLSDWDFFVIHLPNVLQNGIMAGVIFNLLKPAIQCNSTTFFLFFIFYKINICPSDNLEIHKSMNVHVYYRYMLKYSIISPSIENQHHFYIFLRTRKKFLGIPMNVYTSHHKHVCLCVCKYILKYCIISIFLILKYY